MPTMVARLPMYTQEGVQSPSFHGRMPASHRISGQPPYSGHYDSTVAGGGAMLPPGMSPQQQHQMMMAGSWGPEFYRGPGPVPTSGRMVYPMAVRGPPPPLPHSTAGNVLVPPVTSGTETAEPRATGGPTQQKTDAEDAGNKSEGDQFEDLISMLHCTDYALYH